jgi:serine/threonine-protein kinase
VAGEDARIIAMKVERGEVTPLVHAMPEVPREIAGLVHRAMAARPELRFASATEMRLALEGALSGKRVPTVPIPAAAQQRARAGEVVSATGTMQGAPAAEVLAAAALTRPPIRPGDATPSRVASGTNIEQEGPRTERAPPIPMALTPAPAPPSYYQSPPAYTGHPAPPKRGRGSAIWIAVALPLLIGGGVAAFLVASSDRDAPSPSPTLQTTPVATLTAPATQTATTAAPPGDTVAPLVPSPNGVPAGPTTAKPRPSGSHAPSSPSGSATVPPNELPPPEFPPGIPTVLPFPVPSGSNIFTNPFPSGFPTSIPLPFPIPGAPPAQGSGADAGKSL